MWKVDPRLLCRQHLLGEHLEMHMFLGCLRRYQNISGYIENGLVEIDHIPARHVELVREMWMRGYYHRSPLGRPVDMPIALAIARYQTSGIVDVEANLQTLAERCPECAERIRTLGGKEVTGMEKPR